MTVTQLRTLLFSLLLCAACLAPEAQAAQVAFIKEYTYRAGDMDSKVSSRAIALLEVKRALLEQLGTYLVSETEVRNYRMTSDQISLITAGIVSAEVLQERWDGKEYYLQARLRVDPQEVAERVKAISRDRERTRELEDARRRTDQALREVERLKKDMGLAHPDLQGQADRQADYSRAIQELGTDDWYAGYRFHMKDGSSFIWKEYEESGDSYCMPHAAGKVCVPRSDVASIRKGEYPENVEVVPGTPVDSRSRRKAESDWKATQAENERTKRSIDCERLRGALREMRRDSREYRETLDDYHRSCSGVTSAPADQRSDGTERSATKRRSKKQADMDKIIENARDGSVF